MTLPDNVLYKSQGKSKTSATFAQTGQALSWTNINLPKRGASLRLRLKVNVTNCADGTLQFAPEVTVGGSCPAVAATPASGTVKHAKNWVACPPTAACSIATGIDGVFSCPADTFLCTDDYSTLPNVGTLAACAEACAGFDFMTFCSDFTICIFTCACHTQVDGYAPATVFQGYALGEPRDPPENETGCFRRRLEAEQGSA